MNLCDKVTIEVIDNGFLVCFKDRSNYEEKRVAFETIADVWDWLTDYWSYEIKELET